MYKYSLYKNGSTYGSKWVHTFSLASANTTRGISSYTYPIGLLVTSSRPCDHSSTVEETYSNDGRAILLAALHAEGACQSLFPVGYSACSAPDPPWSVRSRLRTCARRVQKCRRGHACHYWRGPRRICRPLRAVRGSSRKKASKCRDSVRQTSRPPESLVTSRGSDSDVCSPKSTEELRGILAVANKYSIPLWTFSRGKNLRWVQFNSPHARFSHSSNDPWVTAADTRCSYGGPAPRLNGSVSLDLHRINRVIEVNEEFAYAVVEPGVSFQDLFDHCFKNKLKVWPSVASLGWGSVLGNVSDLHTLSDTADRVFT